MTSSPITKDDLKKCGTTLLMHLNLGRQGSRTLKQCIEYPRLTIADCFLKKERRAERKFLVDNIECASLDEAVSRLNEPKREAEE